MGPWCKLRRPRRGTADGREIYARLLTPVPGPIWPPVSSPWPDDPMPISEVSGYRTGAHVGRSRGNVGLRGTSCSPLRAEPPTHHRRRGRERSNRPVEAPRLRRGQRALEPALRDAEHRNAAHERRHEAEGEGGARGRHQLAGVTPDSHRKLRRPGPTRPGR